MTVRNIFPQHLRVLGLHGLHDAGWVACRVSPNQRRIDYDHNPTTAGRTAPVAVGYPSSARSHNAWAHAWWIWAPTATWEVDPPLEPLSDSEEEEESDADEPLVLAARPLHLRVPATGHAAPN